MLVRLVIFISLFAGWQAMAQNIVNRYPMQTDAGIYINTVVADSAVRPRFVLHTTEADLRDQNINVNELQGIKFAHEAKGALSLEFSDLGDLPPQLQLYVNYTPLYVNNPTRDPDYFRGTPRVELRWHYSLQ